MVNLLLLFIQEMFSLRFSEFRHGMYVLNQMKRARYVNLMWQNKQGNKKTGKVGTDSQKWPATYSTYNAITVQSQQ